MTTHKIEYIDFKEWDTAAKKIGWIHVHDNFIVVDDENGLCVGEQS